MFSVIILMTLCIVDGGFAGFGAAAGRKSAIRKWHSGYYPRAIVRGVLYSATTLAFPISTALLLMATTGQSVQDLLGNFVIAAQPMMRILGLFTAIVLLAFIPWRITGYEWRTFISVTVFGPLTLVRPFVVLFALSIGVRVWPPRVCSWSELWPSCRQDLCSIGTMAVKTRLKRNGRRKVHRTLESCRVLG